MHYNTHIYLGPSLEIGFAKSLFPQAHYHPPIKCGDLIQLLRLHPKRVLIIDGFYEHVPAVWHKEIMLAIDAGVEVWGAASMGALRAAELHAVGMHGVGEIFQDYATGVLYDDDEVAVLHQGLMDAFAPINDAMVNIRATLKKACSDAVISRACFTALIDDCKQQFYPYRSLKVAMLKHADLFHEDIQSLTRWLDAHGMIDAKRNDAILALKQLQQSVISTKVLPAKMPMTIFLNGIIHYANLKPFSLQADWLPEVEKKLQHLSALYPERFLLIKEFAYLLRKLVSLNSEIKQGIDENSLLSYMREHHLYSPAKDFEYFREHPQLSCVYSLVCQSVCLNHLTLEKLNADISLLLHYYQLPSELHVTHTNMIRAVLVLIHAVNSQLDIPKEHLTEGALRIHINQIARYRGYTREQTVAWLNSEHVSSKKLIDFLSYYIRATETHEFEKLTMKHYFHWIYDAFYCYQNMLCQEFTVA